MIIFRRENKTTAHYARDALVKVRISILDKKWRDFMAQPESRMSLFEGVALISQWSTMEHGKLQTCLKDLGTSIENINKRVNKQMAKVLCASTAKPKKKAEIILDLITHVMFNEMGFKLLPIMYGFHLHFCCIGQVCSALPLCYFYVNMHLDQNLISFIFIFLPLRFLRERNAAQHFCVQSIRKWPGKWIFLVSWFIVKNGMKKTISLID